MNALCLLRGHDWQDRGYEFRACLRCGKRTMKPIFAPGTFKRAALFAALGALAIWLGFRR